MHRREQHIHTQTDPNEGSFQLHGIALSYNYIVGARAIIVSGAEGRMLDALVLEADTSPDEALQAIHFYEVAARTQALRTSAGRVSGLEDALSLLADDGRRRQALACVRDVVSSAQAILRRDYMGFAARISRKGYFHGIEIVRDREGTYRLAFSTDLGSQIEVYAPTIGALLEALIAEIGATKEIINHFKDASYIASIQEIIDLLEDVHAIVSAVRSLSHISEGSTLPRWHRTPPSEARPV